MKEGYLPINIKFKDRRKYYDCFSDYHLKNNDPSMLIDMVTGYVEEELKKYISVLEVANSFNSDWDVER